MICPECERRGKVWEGSDPKCAFSNGVFNGNNWNCATMNKLRDIAESNNLTRWNEDCNAALIPILDEDECPSFIVLGWYKSRGHTGIAFVIDDETQRPLTLEIAESAIKQYEGKK